MTETTDTHDSTSHSKQSENWHQKTLEKVLLETIKEQRRRRRWSIFFKLVVLVYIGLFALFLLPSKKITGGADRLSPHVGLVDLKGMIMPGGDASADNVVAGLSKAFKDPKTVAVILRINSPGGSPVQADYIYNNIMRLRKKYPKKKIYAVCTDMCASAAYYAAVATNDIYADPSSIVGSIGVLLNGFGFVDTMQKLGVERRLITAGSNKDFLDPFSPLKPKDKAYAQKMLDIVHQRFIVDVKKGRGDRLSNNPELFTGLAWTGEQAKPLGLIDGFGSAGYVARNIIKNANVVDYTKRPSFFDQLGHGFGASFGASFGKELATSLGIEGRFLQ